MSSPPVLVGFVWYFCFQFIIYTCIMCIARFFSQTQEVLFLLNNMFVFVRGTSSYISLTVCVPHIYASRYHCLRVCIYLREKQPKKYMVWSWFDYTVIYLKKTLIALSLFTCKCISYTHYIFAYMHMHINRRRT
jgi:hypothetical protein